MKKVLIVIISVISFVVAILNIRFGILVAIDVSKYQSFSNGVQKLTNQAILHFISFAILLCLSIACIVYLIKGSNFLNKAKLTYEEYKELSQKKKVEKQAKNKAKKRLKLENKLKRLE